MKPLAQILSLGLVIGLMVTFTACQKENLKPHAEKNQTNQQPAGDRAAVFYAVTNFDGFNDSRVIGIDQSSSNIVSNVAAFYIDPAGNVINLTNLKGICLTDWGQYFITTGRPGTSSGLPSPYDNSLFKINPLTGQCSYLSTDPGGTVADLEFDPESQNFYGLRENSNEVVEISNANNNNYADYSNPVGVFVPDDGYILKGLSLVKDGNGFYFIGTASNGIGGDPCKLYEIPIAGGVATFMNDLDILGGWVSGNCGIGYDLQYKRVNINRDWAIVTAGLNYFDWQPPVNTNVVTTWTFGADTHDCVDLTSSVY
ncbi:MAG: hypothetical protein JNN28_21330 [Saprospiraceae bacterium]|nr:hypothetical protein [Saprospiraceae bacterium]